jgi:cobalt-precorrin-5B (C1)-methyltransferase
LLAELGATEELVKKAKAANTALEILNLAKANSLDIGTTIAEKAKEQVDEKLNGTEVKIEILICDREGQLVGQAVSDGF